VDRAEVIFQVSGEQPATVEPRGAEVSGAAGAAPASTKPHVYYSFPRPELVPLVPTTARTILDVGCGSGAFAECLRAARPTVPLEIVGVEAVQECAAGAAGRLDRVIIGNIETLDLPYHQHFDCIVFADVLEHLVDPWAVLRRARNWLRPGGSLITSIPNIQHWSVVGPLLRGSWEYRDSGIMDRTHMRFFTRKTMLAMLEDSGYRLRSIEPAIGRKSMLLNRVTARLLENFLARQFMIVAQPLPPR
jgi:O-antigen biosynthesis protein